jgi:hypothetical protein
MRQTPNSPEGLAMKLTAANLIPLWIALLCSITNARAHDTDLRSADVKPRIGQISDEVARQRLTSAGLEQPEVLGREGDQINVRVSLNGQLFTLRVHALTGAITEARDSSRQPVPIPGLTTRPGPIRSQISPTREQISDKALMQRAVVPR